MRYYFDKIISVLLFIHRRKTWPRFIVGAGLVCVTASLAGAVPFFLDLLIAFLLPVGVIDSEPEGFIAVLPVLCFAVGVLLIFAGVAAGFFDWKREKDNRYGLIVELRGLRVSRDVPLEESDIFRQFPKKHTILIDVRDYLDEGNINQPEKAVQKINRTLPEHLLSSIAGQKTKEIQLAFGGLAAVPLTFLSGVLIDDESSVMRLDWDRNLERWRDLTDSDDGVRFHRKVLSDHPEADVLVLCVGVSYPVNVNSVATLFSTEHIKLMELYLPDYGPDNHWSDEKQTALAVQFTSVLFNHSNFKKIHLYIAAPSSLVFLFGQRYDRRNLPPVCVYQFERGQTPEYPWAVEMPVAGNPAAEVMWTKSESESCI